MSRSSSSSTSSRCLPCTHRHATSVRLAARKGKKADSVGSAVRTIHRIEAAPHSSGRPALPAVDDRQPVGAAIGSGRASEPEVLLGFWGRRTHPERICVRQRSVSLAAWRPEFPYCQSARDRRCGASALCISWRRHSGAACSSGSLPMASLVLASMFIYQSASSSGARHTRHRLSLPPLCALAAQLEEQRRRQSSLTAAGCAGHLPPTVRVGWKRQGSSTWPPCVTAAHTCRSPWCCD